VSASLGRLLPGLDARSVGEAAIAAVLGVALGAVGGVPLLLAGPLPVAGAVAALILRSRRAAAAREVAFLPLVAALGIVAVLAVPSLFAGALAGLAGLAVLLWYARTPGVEAETAATVDPIDGLALPAVGVVVALLVGVALPSANSAVGLAAVAVVATVGIVLWALLRSVAEGPGAGEPL
jgi:hypothetical protein